MADHGRRHASDAPRPILARVGTRCVDELGVEFATIVVATSSSTWAPAYATSDIASGLEQFAFTVGEGPCFDAVRTHAPVLVPDLTASSALARWPAWAGAARDLGIGSVASLPIQAGAIVAGALTMCSREARHLEGDRLTVALRLADAAFLGLLDLMAGLDDPATDDADVLNLLRADVHRAAGMVMVQAAVPIDQALVRLRAYSFSAERPVADVAADVISRRLRFDAAD
jgi:hypothetical protein